MYYTSDLQYMRKELKFSLSLIDYIQKRYGDELTDTQRSRIMYLLQVLKELRLDVKYLNQNPEILNCIDVYTNEEFLSLIEYIKKMAKKKSPNVIIAFFISAEQIIKNNRQSEIEQIIKLLEKEGLADLLENKSINTKIMQDASYMTIYKNITALSQVKTYRNIIRKNPEILIAGTTYDIQKIVEKIKLMDNKEDINEQSSFEENNSELEENLEINEEKENELNNDEEDNYSDDGKVLLGNEDNVVKVIEAFKKYNIPYNIIFIYPEICKRKKIYEVENILKILYDNSIPFNILDYSSEILEVGKSKNILEIIKYMKSNNINLDILCVCPDILIKSNIKKIENVLNMLDKEKLDRYIIYSCPQVLISGNAKIFIEMKNEIETTMPDINIVLDMAPYVFVEKIANMANILDDSYSELVNKSYLSNSSKITVVRNIDEAQKVINVLKEEKIDLSIIKEDPKVLTKTSAKQTKDILTELNSIGLNKNIVQEKPELLVYSSAIVLRETTSKLKEYRPLKYKEIIQEVPSIYIKSDSNKIQSIMDTFEEEKISYTFIDNNPTVLIRENEEEIGKVTRRLKSKGFTSEQIVEIPKILIEGKEKYIDRNINVLEKNKLSLPLCAAYTMKTRKLEKNIDVYIENGLYGHINDNPDLLDIDNIRLTTNIALSKIYGIPLLDKNEKKVNKEYLQADTKDLIEKYGMDKELIEKAKSKIEKRRDRKIKNIELYNKIYPILDEQADICLEQYKNNEVSFAKNNKIISKQKLIRETYLDLEEAYDKKGKMAIREFCPDEKLDKKLEHLTKKKNEEINKPVEKPKEDKKEISIEKGE